MKQLVYKNSMNIHDQLRQEMSATAVYFEPMMLLNTRQSFMKRRDKFIEVSGEHIEHLPRLPL